MGTQNFHQIRLLVHTIMQEIVNTLREEREKKKSKRERGQEIRKQHINISGVRGWARWIGRLGLTYLYYAHEKFTQCFAAKSLQSCPTLCDLIDGSPPGSPVPGILQARTLEWVAVSLSNA